MKVKADGDESSPYAAMMLVAQGVQGAGHQYSPHQTPATGRNRTLDQGPSLLSGPLPARNEDRTDGGCYLSPLTAPAGRGVCCGCHL